MTEESILPIFLKTGDQSRRKDCDITTGTQGSREYKFFRRSDFLEVLDTYDGDHPIVVDYRNHLREIKRDYESHDGWPEATLSEWTMGPWRRLFCTLEKQDLRTQVEYETTRNGKEFEIRYPDWGYVNNRGGGFLALFWNFRDIQIGQGKSAGRHRFFLQLEITVRNRKTAKHELCFKVGVEENKGRRERTDHRRRLRDEYAKDIEKAADSVLGAGVVVSPDRMGNGQTMTLRVWRDWLVFSNDGGRRLDMKGTVENLKQAEHILDDACERARQRRAASAD